MKTAKAIPTKTAIFQYFQGHHLALEVYDRASINEADVEKRLRAAGGAHQPSDMQFPGGGSAVKIGVDLSGGVSAPSTAPTSPAVPAPAVIKTLPKPAVAADPAAAVSAAAAKAKALAAAGDSVASADVAALAAQLESIVTMLKK